MRDLFHFFPTVEEETQNVTRYYQLFERVILLKKLTNAFIFTTLIAEFIYLQNALAVNSYKLQSFTILCALFTIVLAVVMVINYFILNHIASQSYQIPGKSKKLIDISLKSLYQLMEDDLTIHQNMKEFVSKDNALFNLENNRFDLICNTHFFIWRTLNECAYADIMANHPSTEEIDSLHQQQEAYKEDFLKMFVNSPEICKKVNEWYQEFEQKMTIQKSS